MSEINKPAWVDALDEAQTALRDAALVGDANPDSKVRLAFAWMDVARLLKG